MKIKNFNDALAFINSQEKDLKELFEKIDDRVLFNQKKVLDAFKEHRVSLTDFAGSSGYGYDDRGKGKLGLVVAQIFGTESALVSPQFTCGTHAISCALFGILRAGDTLLSISGAPYDTLVDVISGKGIGSLTEMGVKYHEVPLKNGKFDTQNISKAVYHLMPKVVYIQRSRGYSDREPFSILEIKDIIAEVRKADKNCIVFVDNCYGELVEKQEPTEVGADICVGSLIKNLGGGMAPTGGYVAGKTDLVEQVARHLTAPTLGSEVGSYKAGYTEFFEGLFVAPHVVGGAIKGVLLETKVLSALGYKTKPAATLIPKDIICSVDFGDAKKLVSFCKAIQQNSPVDSFLSPEPWDMPGYTSQVIMAAGTFVQGSSIELSCDGPVKPPYRAYLQGGLTYEHIKLALANAITQI